MPFICTALQRFHMIEPYSTIDRTRGKNKILLNKDQQIPLLSLFKIMDMLSQLCDTKPPNCFTYTHTLLAILTLQSGLLS